MLHTSLPHAMLCSILSIIHFASGDCELLAFWYSHNKSQEDRRDNPSDSCTQRSYTDIQPQFCIVFLDMKYIDLCNFLAENLSVTLAISLLRVHSKQYT